MPVKRFRVLFATNREGRSVEPLDTAGENYETQIKKGCSRNIVVSEPGEKYTHGATLSLIFENDTLESNRRRSELLLECGESLYLVHPE